MPSDPAKKAVYESRMAAYQQRQENKQDKAGAGANDAANNTDQPAATTTTKDTPAEMRLDANDPPMQQQPLTPEQQQKKQREEAMYADIENTPPAANAKNTNTTAANRPDSASMPLRSSANSRSGVKRRCTPISKAANLLQMSPDDRYKAIMKMSADERLDLARTYKGHRGHAVGGRHEARATRDR